MEGLEVSELLLSDVRRENSKLRLDSGFFTKPMLMADAIVRGYSVGCDELGTLFSRFVKGIFDINANSYTDSGVPFLRILNLRQGVIDENNIAFIPEVIHQDEKKTELCRGDIVLSKTAYPAASLVTLDRCNTSQDTIATTMSAYGASNYRAEAVVAYLNCDIGQQLLWRQFQGNVQLHLSLDDGRKVPIPKFGTHLQDEITKAFTAAELARRESAQQMRSAEQALERTLDFENWQVPESLSYERNSRDAFAAGRLDAEHFQEKYYALQEKLSQQPLGYRTIGQLAMSLTNGAEIREYQAEGVPYLRVGDVKNLTIDEGSVVRVDSALAEKELKKVGLEVGDVLVSRSGSLAVTAVVEKEWSHSLISSHLIRVKIADSDYDPYYVALFLKTVPGRMQIFQWSNGGVQPEISQPSLNRIVVPRVENKIQEEIRDLIFQSRNERERATQLLDAAKRAVEIAIEQDEKSALTYLEAYS